jgi:hypothetical protein
MSHQGAITAAVNSIAGWHLSEAASHRDHKRIGLPALRIGPSSSGLTPSKWRIIAWPRRSQSTAATPDATAAVQSACTWRNGGVLTCSDPRRNLAQMCEHFVTIKASGRVVARTQSAL